MGKMKTCKRIGHGNKGRVSFRKGLTLTEEHKKNLRIAAKRRKEKLGYIHSPETRLKLSISHKGKFTGENHPNWKGGALKAAEHLRYCLKYKEWRQSVFIRDDFTCKECGVRGEYIEAHHLKSFAELIQEARNYLPLLELYDSCLLYSPMWDTSNGVTLCRSCHDKTKKGRTKKKL